MSDTQARENKKRELQMIEHINGVIVQNDDGSRWLSLDEPCSISMQLASEKVRENISDEMVVAAVKIWVDGNQDLYSENFNEDCKTLMRSALESALDAA